MRASRVSVQAISRSSGIVGVSEFPTAWSPVLIDSTYGVFLSKQ